MFKLFNSFYMLFNSLFPIIIIPIKFAKKKIMYIWWLENSGHLMNIYIGYNFSHIPYPIVALFMCLSYIWGVDRFWPVVTIC